MSEVIVDTLKHSGNSGTANVTLASNGDVTLANDLTVTDTLTVPTKKLACPGTIVQVKNVHWTGNVQEQVGPSNSSLTVWEYDNANLRVSLTPTSTSNRILVMSHLTIGSENGLGIYVRLYRKLGSGTGSPVGQPADSGSRPSCITQIQDVANNTSEASNISFTYFDTPANTTDEHTYYFGFHHPSSSNRWIMINRTYDNQDNYYHALSSSGITLMEVAV